MSIFDRKNKKADDARTRRIAREEARKEQRDDKEETGDPRIDRLYNRVDDLADRMEQLTDNGGSESDGGMMGTVGSYLKYFNTLQIQNASNFAINVGTTSAAGPLDPATKVVIGGSTYDPGASTATIPTNGRILKWTVNQTVLHGRAFRAVLLYVVTLLAWSLLDVISDDDFDSDSMFEDLIMMQMLFSSGSNTNGGIFGGIGFGLLGSLFNNNSNGAPLLDPTLWYPNI